MEAILFLPSYSHVQCEEVSSWRIMGCWRMEKKSLVFRRLSRLLKVGDISRLFRALAILELSQM